MNESLSAGLKVVEEMIDDNTAAQINASIGSDAFGAKMGEFSVDFVFGKVWARPNLSRRDRSLVTLGILIASRSTDELKIHTQIAIKNGCTVSDLEEVLYQASAYAGFPAASSAYRVMMETLRQHGHLT